MIQTLVLGASNLFFTGCLYCIGSDYLCIPWIDHIPKLSDPLLALIYVTSIALFNKAVRNHLVTLFSCGERITPSADTSSRGNNVIVRTIQN
ncbi:hypothetical protein Y032_0048g1554 [Ancylostoma ceylanicum]|uniref:7TM GPCR serpentine receptor class x (Srx) domain-containing protein n=1 Tax=Ancylostoma ceylanicum TaxID=53326 RepID=A0A016UAN9_9BILA|nr:hypothetical protein Y032_0048g1554 [Ancylostoma ceylanicum]